MNQEFRGIKKIVKLISSESKKMKKKSALVMITTIRKSKDEFVILPIRRTDNLVCATVAIYNLRSAKQIVNEFDGKIDYIIIDAEQKITGLKNIVKIIIKQTSQSEVLTFKSNDSTADATDSLISNLFFIPMDKKIGIIGAGNIGSKVALKLVERGYDVSLSCRTLKESKKIALALNLIKPKNCLKKIIPKDSATIAKNCHLLIGFTNGIPAITSDMVQQMKKNGIILDGGIGTIESEAISQALKKEIKIIRLDITPSFTSSMTLLFKTKNHLNEVFGNKKIKGIEVVSGGYYGKYGDVVVDNITKPTQLIGIADGRGDIMRHNFSNEFKKNIETINHWILNKKNN
jgi:hypothetical protein